MVKLFKYRTKEQEADTLASFLPDGRPFLAKRYSGTTLRGLLLGLGQECLRAEGHLNDMTHEHDIRTTTWLIEEWESALGIPDDCIPVANTLEQRRKNVLLKLSALGLQTQKDYEDLAAVLGGTITIEKGGEYGIFPFTSFPIEFFDAPMTARFTWRIKIYNIDPPCIFPFNNLFPICFSSGISNIIECLFTKLKPYNTDLKFVYP